MSGGSESPGDFAVRVDFERILQTISSQIYDNQFAFLRENVQNAIDAVRIQAIRDRVPSGDSRYRIDVLIQNNICSIVDNGNGMTKTELENNFWTMGASGKTTSEAKAAGCIGVFGIGGFANFGVCDTLEVISRTDDLPIAHHTRLSKSDFTADRFNLPKVTYRESQELGHRGTIVRGTARTAFDVHALTAYLREFVRYVPEGVYMQNQLISQDKVAAPTGNYRALTDTITGKQGDISVRFEIFADDGNNLSARLHALRTGERDHRFEGSVRLVHGELNVYKRGFRICSVHVSSRIGVTGSVDCDILQPTAGRDTLDSKSLVLLNQIFHIVEAAVGPIILADPDLLSNHIRLIPDFVANGHLEKLGLLSVGTVEGRSLTLAELRDASQRGRRVFYTSSARKTAAAEVLQARGNLIVVLSTNPQRRSAEIQYLQTYCSAEQFDNLIECLEIYSDLETFERAALAELDLAIRKLFKPGPYRFTAGKLTMDVPIYWSNKKESGATVVFVDTRHGELQKLRPLGYSGLFWSMIEAFCREYLGDTLKRESPKFFGSGAIDLDAYSKSHAELWELMSSDIEISTIAGAAASRGRRGGRIEIVRRQDIAQVEISAESGVTEEQPAQPPLAGTEAPEPREPAKLLRIVDQTGSTGLEGYYLRIPESATAAFGDLIRTFSSFAILWFANRITWQGSDLKSTAFLFDVTLDRLIKAEASGGAAHGALELSQVRIQNYKNQIYFYIPSLLTEYMVPRDESDSIKIEVKPELVDLTRPRSWIAKETL